MTPPIVLVVNCGSSSLRAYLIDPDSRRRLAGCHVERIGAVTSLASTTAAGGGRERHSLVARDHAEALDYALNYFVRHSDTAIAAPTDITAVGHRVVHGGEQIAGSVLIDDTVIEVITDAFDLAPLHNPANLQGIEAARRAFPDAPHVAVFDTAFHQSIPEHAYLYALPYRLYRRHKMRRYGFHGTSHFYVSRRLYELTGVDRAASRIITCHLGNGCSVAAIRNGRSVDTSMGMSPLAGLVMGTRVGDVDPTVIFDVAEKEELALHEIHTLLNRYSGLQGLSGFSSDMRDLEEQAAAGDLRCQLAIDVFCYRAKSYIGQYLAVLNGCDALVFTAGIGENAPGIRREICADLDNLGIVLDPTRNEQTTGEAGRISSDASRVAVWVVPTDEEMVIATDTLTIARGLGAGTT